MRSGLLLLGAVLLVLAAAATGWLLRGEERPAATHGPVDVGFAHDMSVHHAQAVDMATTELTGGSDPAVQNLAFDILTSQQNQIGRMQGWLTSWGEPLLPTGGHMGWMAAHEHHSGMGGGGMGGGGMSGPMASMPGMASPAEMDALRRAAPAARDVLFLQLMLRHHQGGTDMLADAAERAETGYVRALATQMLATQNSESALMTSMLRDRNAPVLPLR